MDRKRLFVSAPQRVHERSYSTHTRLYWQERVRLRQDSLLDHIPAAIPETAVRHAKTPLLGRNAPLGRGVQQRLGGCSTSMKTCISWSLTLCFRMTMAPILPKNLAAEGQV